MRLPRSAVGRDPAVVRWWATLGVGAVVVLVVWALLESLRRAALGVDRAVADVWMAGKRLAQNTQAAHTLQTTRERGGEVAAEAESVRDLVREGGT